MKKLVVLLGLILLSNSSYANDGFYMYCTQDSNQRIKCEPIQNVVKTSDPYQNNTNQQQPDQSQYYKTRTAVQNTSGTINDISNTIYSLQSMIGTIKNF